MYCQMGWIGCAYYFAGSSKSHRENSISFIFLESPHQIDMRNVVKSSKHFFGYFNTLETQSERWIQLLFQWNFGQNSWKVLLWSSKFPNKNKWTEIEGCIYGFFIIRIFLFTSEFLRKCSWIQLMIIIQCTFLMYRPAIT